jgi:hypothetical protein
MPNTSRPKAERHLNQDQIPTVRPPRPFSPVAPNLEGSVPEPPTSLWQLWVLARDLMLAEADEALDRERKRSD